jgi:hypothetical protein
MGRTVQVRGIAAFCLASDSHRYGPFCGHWSVLLLDAGGTNAVLPLAWQRQDDLLAFLRSTPLLSQFVAPAQTLHWGLPATYRVELRAAEGDLCGPPPCYEAMLLDLAWPWLATGVSN